MKNGINVLIVVIVVLSVFNFDLTSRSTDKQIRLSELNEWIS